jgi:hypothetical protein
MKYVLILFVICFACQNGSQESMTENSTVSSGKLKFQESLLLGKKIRIDEIIGDSISIVNRSLLLYTGYDCGSCVHAGFHLINMIDSVSRSNHSIVLEIQSNKGRDQLNHGYKNYIFSDSKDEIRKQLKYVNTPVVLSFDKYGKISQVYFPEDVSRIDEILVKKFAKM